MSMIRKLSRQILHENGLLPIKPSRRSQEKQQRKLRRWTHQLDRQTRLQMRRASRFEQRHRLLGAVMRDKLATEGGEAE